ncbi:MAG: UDP-N-acetylmuramoyl-L-alanine--D-glutamate ligase [Chitinophagales bacterium]
MNKKLKIAILGAAESGVGTAILAQQQGFNVFVSDFGTISEKYKEILNAHQIRWEEGGHSEEEIFQADEVMKSPGIPEKATIIKKLREKSIPIVSEIEFAARYTKAKIIAITGSNGKTTTTSLIYALLKDAGFNVGLGGNIGKSFANLVATEKHDYYVLEISSFQLDDCYDFRPDIAVLCNITPDHLDRYNYSFDAYVQAKFKLTQKQRAEDLFIYCLDDEATMNFMSQHPLQARTIPFSIKKEVEEGAYLNENELTIKLNKTIFTMSINELQIKGQHNVYNSMAAGIVARALDLRKENIRESLADFKNVEHRMEKVLKIGGIEFINDSKATNVNSTWYAMESIQTPIVWIAGGVDKGNDYEVLKALVRKKVHTIICLGTDSRNLHEAFSHQTGLMINVHDMHEAVRIANHFANKGDAVLLSPACASFDLFENYEDRGNQFKAAVRNL